MKSSVFCTLIGLLSMAANVQAYCTLSDYCPREKYCSNPGYNNGECVSKKKGGESTDKAYKCFSNILKDGKCGCTAHTGIYGCKDINRVCFDRKCVTIAKKVGGETCNHHWECFTNLKFGNKCACTSQTGNTGCKNGNICNLYNGQCLDIKPKGLGESCSYNYECKSTWCIGTRCSEMKQLKPLGPYS